MPESKAPEIAVGLSKLRRKRWLLWSVFLTYVPVIWLSLKLTHSDKVTGVVFGIWVLLAAVFGSVAGFGRCPRCGNYFHVKGLMPVWVRKCLHCDLSIRADKERIAGV